MNKQLIEILKSFDITQLLKGKGDLRRWSAKRTIGGLIVVYALTSMEGAITTNGILLCCVGILPLCLSFLEKD
tara:strand:- start:2200 stop:2418 length:219 start_codon:yes stop_codon:yes gene_type:complete